MKPTKVTAKKKKSLTKKPLKILVETQGSPYKIKNGPPLRLK